ncbi:MAG: cytochrome-c peroxidase [Flavobacteriales bacterium]|jgi:cytochrome c peroxidase
MRYFIWFLSSVFLLACGEEERKWNDHAVDYRYPSWWPEMVVPQDNLPTQLRLELGRRLFFSKELSASKEVSCGSCHVASAAFTDGKTVSVGAHGKSGKRNAPTLANLGWHPYYMMEGGVPHLELQAMAPMTDSLEMNGNIMAIVHRLEEDQLLQDLSQAAYGRPFDVYVLTRALACYQRSFISTDSRFDRTYYEHNDQMSEDEKAGMNLFFSNKTNCSSCHALPNFTDYGFYNVGLSKQYSDPGKKRENYKDEDEGKFKTPSLRNSELTAPYMHDGSLNTLEEVIDHFNTGGKGHVNQDARIKPLGLTEQEKKQLVLFLKTLTDWNFVQNSAFLPYE